MSSGKIKTPIVDKNGKSTNVWKKSEIDNSPIRSALIPIAKTASMYSGQEILQSPPIQLDVDEEYDFSVQDGIDLNGDIPRAQIYRTEDNENGEPVYRATAYGHWMKPKEFLADSFGMTEEEQEEWLQDKSDIIERFMLRDYDITEIEWNDDYEFVPLWAFERNEPISVDEAFDEWAGTDTLDVFNESDPGTFGSRNMWRALMEEVSAYNEVEFMETPELLEGAKENPYGHSSFDVELRAIAFDKRFAGNSGLLVVAQRDLIQNSKAPWDAIAHVVNNSKDESIQLMAVETGKLPSSALSELRAKTQHDSVRAAIDDINNDEIMSDFVARNNNRQQS